MQVDRSIGQLLSLQQLFEAFSQYVQASGNFYLLPTDKLPMLVNNWNTLPCNKPLKDAIACQISPGRVPYKFIESSFLGYHHPFLSSALL